MILLFIILMVVSAFFALSQTNDLGIFLGMFSIYAIVSCGVVGVVAILMAILEHM